VCLAILAVSAESQRWEREPAQAQMSALVLALMCLAILAVSAVSQRWEGKGLQGKM
jgi:hypothetical protein